MFKTKQITKPGIRAARLGLLSSIPYNAESGETFNIDTYTVANALDEYFKDREVNGSKSIDTVKQSAKAWIVPALGNVLLIDLTKKRIKDWRDSIAESPRRVRTSAGKEQAYAAPPATLDERRARRDSANRILTILKAALNYVYEVYDNLSSAVPPCWQKVKRFENTTKARTRFLSEEEKTKLIKACPPDFRDLVRGALLTGCRYGELARLRCKDYSPRSGTLTIVADITKSSKERHIVLDKKGVALFDRLVSKKTSPDDLIFTNGIKRTRRTANGGGWLPSDQCQFMKKACQKAGFKPIRFHELRHTYASMLVNEGVALVYVAAQLGHSGIGMVEKYYGHLATNDKAKSIRAAMSKLGGRA